MKSIRPRDLLALALTAILGTCAVLAARASNEDDVLTTATALDSGGSYQNGMLPGLSSDLTFTASTYNNTAFTLNTIVVSVTSLDDLDATQALTISASQRLTLYGQSNGVAGSAAGDLLYLATGANLTYSGTGNIRLFNSGNFDLAGTAQATINAIITGGGYAITKSGTGMLTLTGVNTYSGGTTFAGGILDVGNTKALGTTGSLVFSGGTLQYGGTNNTDYSTRFSTAANQAYSIDTNGQTVIYATGLTSSGGSFTKLGAGTLTLTGNNTYTGGTTFAGGILDAGSAGAFGATGSLVFSGGELQYSSSNQTDYSPRFSTTASQAYSVDTNGQNITFGTALTSSGGSLTKLGAGTLTLTVNNTYTGTTTIGGGTLQVGSGGTTGTLGADAVIDNGVLTFNRSDNITGANVISGSGELIQAGGGTLTLTASNSYSGTTTLAAGTVNASDPNALGTGTLLFSGGTLQYGGSNTSDYSSRFSTAAGQAYSIDTNGQNVTYATGLTSNGGSLTKAGAGTLTLTSDSTYAGTTTVSGGTLQLGNGGTAGSLGTGAVIDNGALVLNRSDNAITVANAISGSGSLTQVIAGTLTLTGANTYAGTTTIARYGTIQVGNGGTTGTLGTGAVNGNGTLVFNRSDNITVANTINAGGLTQAGGGTLTLTGSNSYGDHIAVNAGTLAILGYVYSYSAYATVDSLLTIGDTGDVILGDCQVGLHNNGAVVQSGFVHASTLTVGYVNEGTYTLGGSYGGLQTGSAYVGYFAAGTFNQSGGFFAMAASPLCLGYRSGGTYNLSGGTLMTGITQVGDWANTSVFNQSGGTHTTFTLSLTGESYDGTAMGIYNLNGGTLAVGRITTGDQINSDSYGPGNSIFNFNGGTVQAIAASTTFFQGLTTATVQSGGAIFDTNTFNDTVAQALLHDSTLGGTADGGLTKLGGTGTLTLSGANTYTGPTVVNAGTLLVNGTSSGTGAVIVQNSGSVLGGTGTISAAVSVTTGMLAPGNNAGANGSAANSGKLTVGALTLSSTATPTFDIASGTTYDQLFANGNIALGSSALTLNVTSSNTAYTIGQTLDLFHNNSGTLSGTFGNFANNGLYTYGGDTFRANYTSTDFTLTVTAVPEPATWLAGALLVGGAGLTLRRRRLPAA